MDAEWQPIDTAPLDGTRVLVGWHGKPDVQIAAWWPKDNYWSLDDMRSLDDPTHWKPLPNPPGFILEGGTL